MTSEVEEEEEEEAEGGGMEVPSNRERRVEVSCWRSDREGVPSPSITTPRREGRGAREKG